MKKRVHLFISGRVQGVYFRDSLKAKAQARGITGWVGNLPDGRVETIAEGDENAVDELVNWCHSGPPDAVVTQVEVHQEDFTGSFTNFVIITVPYAYSTSA